MNKLANAVYDTTIDYIMARARDNELRGSYEQVMGSGHWNSSEMATLVDVICAVAESPLDRARDDREAMGIIKDAVSRVVDMHVGYYGMSDRSIWERVPDDIYTALKHSAHEWEGLMSDLSGATRGAGRSSYNQTNNWGNSQRQSVFDNQPRQGFGGGRGSVFDSRSQPNQQRGSNSVFGQTAMPQRASSVFDDMPTHAPQQPQGHWRDPAPVQRPTSGLGSASMPPRPQAPQQAARHHTIPDLEMEISTPPPLAQRMRQPEPKRHDGPDYSKDRPFDDFFNGDDHWQVAHLSEFTWSWSPQQTARRQYSIDDEVCFLVKNKNGQVREEFIAMSDDLTMYAHEIRQRQRPNMRRGDEMANVDPIFPGEDYDDTQEMKEARKRMRQQVEKQLLESMDPRFVVVKRSPASAATLEEAAFNTVAEVANNEEDQKQHVVIKPHFLTTALSGDEETQNLLDSIRTVQESDGADLTTMVTRLKTLRGRLPENILTYIDRHFAKEVNDCVRDQFGQKGLSIDSLIDDYDALINCKRFKDLGNGYISQFANRTRRILGSINFIVGETRNEFMEIAEVVPSHDNELETYSSFRDDAAVIWRPVTVAYVAVDSDEFDGVDEETRFPGKDDTHIANLYKTIYQKALEANGGGRIYLLTLDNVMFELIPHFGARDSIGIRRV